MVQSPSWEANWFAASQEIPRISRNPKVNYRTHKRPPPVSILGPPNPIHIPTSYLLEIHPNIIHPSTPRPPQWSLSLRFPHQDPIHPPLINHTHSYPAYRRPFLYPQPVDAPCRGDRDPLQGDHRSYTLILWTWLQWNLYKTERAWNGNLFWTERVWSHLNNTDSIYN